MAHIKYTWTRSELYNKDGIQVFIIRCNEDGRKKAWEIVENGIARKATHHEVSPYIEPDYEKRKAIKEKRIATFKARKALRANMADWKEELNFTWA